MARKTPILLLAAAFAACGAYAAAQAKDAPNKDAQQKDAPQKDAASKDVQAKIEPTGGPGAGQAFLKTFEGEWNVVRNFYPPAGGPPNTATGEATQKMVQDGRFLESDFTFHQDGKTTTGTGISGFDPKTSLFTTFWYDSRSTRFSIRQSREPFDGKQIVLYSAALGGSDGNQRQSRTVSHLEDNGNKLVHQQFNMGSDGAEHVLMELILTKKKAK